MDFINTHKTRALIAMGILLVFAVSAVAQSGVSKSVASQIAAIQQFKQSLTPAQKKMDSSLAFANAGQKNPASVSAFSSAMPQLSTTTTAKVAVDVHGTVSPALLQAIKSAGGDVTYASTRWNAVRASIPLSTIDSIAARSDVTRISKAPLVRTGVGSLTSQGYIAHRAKQVVEQSPYKGGGVNVGVLSDSALPAEVAALKASGDLPANSYVLASQDGPSNGTNEGTAMMEIVYDMAPGSTPIFATAFTSEASFADNIIALQQAGCKVIADDVTYSDEGAFQDTIVAQAVNTVVANGSTYFSSAGNSGSLHNANSEAYEGDFKDGGPATGILAGAGEVHDFGGQLFNRVAGAPSGVVLLQWSDPYPGACNDYDLYVTNSSGTVLKAFSASTQDCSAGSIPDEEAVYGNPAVGDRIYVVLFAGSARALHVGGWGSTLQIATTGNSWGHNAGKNTISMAATYWGSAHKGAVPFTGMANPVEPFSSDGPRKIFYQPDGTPITPGNYLFATNGGTTLLKPDLTAADGVFTKTPGFLPFFGTSAASPHAAGIAALVVSARPGYTPAQVKTSMVKSALDNMSVGCDINGGCGVAMANGAVSYALAH
jgi:hypothetical protein